jgi:DNA-binding NtrC family response regulator
MILHKLVLVEDEPDVCRQSVAHFLTPEFGFDCRRKEWKSIVPPAMPSLEAELVVLANSSDRELAVNLFNWLREHPLAAPTIAVFPPDSPSEFLHAAAEAVDDFVLAPVRSEEFRYRVTRMLGSRSGGEDSCRDLHDLKQKLGLAQFIGEDAAFARVIHSIPGIAASSAPVLLLGETGTGKELCAHAVHSLSPRHAGPFVPVECGAIPENLFENELFGHVRGAFTDAHTAQTGLVAMAEGGTLFLDEVDSLPLAAQAKLLRLVQEGTYRQLGAQKFACADIRLVAASNRDLEASVRAGEFRADLYFRLNVLPLHLPPLRERHRDIAVLARHFLRTLNTATQLEKRLSPGALRTLESYAWPGNVRELHNVMQRAAAFCGDSAILPCHLGLPIATSADASCDGGFRLERSRAVAKFEKTYLEGILSRHGGNVSRAANAAGKDRRVFGRLMRKYGIDRRRFQ